MRAAILNGYDKNGCDLILKDIPIPEISDQEVLVKIHTAGVNPLDNMIIHGEVKILFHFCSRGRSRSGAYLRDICAAAY